MFSTLRKIITWCYMKTGLLEWGIPSSSWQLWPLKLIQHLCKSWDTAMWLSGSKITSNPTCKGPPIYLQKKLKKKKNCWDEIAVFKKTNSQEKDKTRPKTLLEQWVSLKKKISSLEFLCESCKVILRDTQMKTKTITTRDQGTWTDS